MPIIVLKDVASDTVLPIWVGIFEANAIALELEKTATPRPMTHDLMRNMARGLNAVVRKVVVSELRDDTFYAVIWMEQDGETVALDSRPSDAIALALRWDCPIFASRAVLDTAKQIPEGPQNVDGEEARRWLENLNDDDMGRYKM
jgi:bifunctional DNase/RNase